MTYKVCLACGRLEDDTEIRERIEAETIQKKLQELEQLKEKICSYLQKQKDLLFSYWKMGFGKVNIDEKY